MSNIEEKLKEIQSEIGCCRYHMESAKFRQEIIDVFLEAIGRAEPKTFPSNLTDEMRGYCERVTGLYKANLLKELKPKKGSL